MYLQVGCPEGRIDENVAKLTSAGYKVNADTLLVKSKLVAGDVV